MAVGDLLKYAHRALFAKPSPERQLLKLVKQQPIRRVVEVGVESIETTSQLLNALAKQAGGEPIVYTAIDPFDERPAPLEPLPLRQAYRSLVATQAQTRLIPGPLGPSVAAEANSLADTDLLLLSREASDAELGGAWFYIPRMCHPGTMVLRRVEGETPDSQGGWAAVMLDEVSALASQATAQPMAA